MSQNEEVSLELSLGSKFQTLVLWLWHPLERRSCLETQQDKLPSLPIPAKPAP